MPASIDEVEFGEELPAFDPNTSMDNVNRFTAAAHPHYMACIS